MELLARVRGTCRLRWIADVADPALGPMARLLARSGEVLDTAGRSAREVAADLASGPDPGIDGVVAFGDTQLETAALLAGALGLPGNPPASVALLNDKLEQRRALAAAGIEVPGFRLLGPGVPASIAEATDGLTFPLVVKPLQGDSSRDVVAVADAARLRDALDAAGTTGVLVEEFLADRAEPPAPGIAGYVSVESIAADGRVVPIAITGKFPLAEPFRETGNFMPHPLPRDEAHEVLSLAERAAHALGVRSGALHIEIKLTPTGPRVIEVNGRVGGGAIDVLAFRRFGRSLTHLAVDVALGRPLTAEPEAAAAHAGPFLYECFLQAPTSATRFGGLRGLEAVAALDGVSDVFANRSAGDELDWRAGSQGYLLRVSGTSPDLVALGHVPAAVLAAADPTYD